MGLDISHDAWHGSYSSFNNWRMKIAEVVGIPLPLMEGYYDFCSHILIRSDTQMYKEFLPIKWESLKEENGGLRILLDHSDCGGEFSWEEAGLVANALKRILPLLPDGEAPGHIHNWKEKTQQFIDGCEKAFKNKETMEFG